MIGCKTIPTSGAGNRFAKSRLQPNDILQKIRRFFQHFLCRASRTTYFCNGNEQESSKPPRSTNTKTKHSCSPQSLSFF